MPTALPAAASWDRIARLDTVLPIETLRALSGRPRYRPGLRVAWSGRSDGPAAAASASEPYWARGKAELDALVLLADIPRLEPRGAR